MGKCPLRGVMSDALKAQISAFVDGELPDNESELLLRRLSQDAALRAQVDQYMAIGRLIRQDAEVPGMDDLRDRIAATLDDEVVPAQAHEQEQQRVVGSRFMTPATGVAVAATVAALALVGLSQLDASIDADLAGAVAIAYTEPAVEQALANQPNQQLLEYIRRHGDSSSDLGTSGTLTRMVMFELREGELVEIEPDAHLLPVVADEDLQDTNPQ